MRMWKSKPTQIWIIVTLVKKKQHQTCAYKTAEMTGDHGKRLNIHFCAKTAQIINIYLYVYLCDGFSRQKHNEKMTYLISSL